MAGTAWQLKGHYFETCNCDYLCPCLPSNLTAPPTHGDCKVALAYHVEDGHFGDTQLDDLSFVLVAHVPGPLAEGNWTVGLIIDERASGEQQEALGKICSGAEGGAPAVIAPLIGSFAGIEVRPIRFEKNGKSYSVSIPDMVDQAAEGVASGAVPEDTLYLDNCFHPSNTRLALAKATRSHVHAFGIDWDDTSGNNNGHFAPFTWQGD